VDQPQLIGRGGTAEVYSWKKDQVLKLFFDWVPASWIWHEVELAQRVSASSLPTPKFIETTTYSNRSAIVYERIDGHTMLHLISSRPWLVKSQARMLARLHAQINQQSGAGLPSLHLDIRNRISTVQNLPDSLKGFALDILDDLPDGKSLCHFDFHPDQVMVNSKGHLILDWMAALQGDPAADVAHTSNLLTLARPPKTNWLMEKVIDAARGAFFNSYKVESLALRPDLNWDVVNRWRIPAAAARLGAGIAGEEAPILDFLKNELQKQRGHSLST
jgi:aminoglycoside phosphotransferase (APT) family kinase protein